MDVRIGVMYAPKEIVLEIDDGAPAAEALTAAVESATASGGMIWVEDKRGRRVGIPADKLAYVEFGSPDDHRVGFGVS